MQPEMGNSKIQILQDHTRQGNKLVPPFLASFNLQEISYINQILPETFWMAFLNKRYGYSQGAEVSLEIVKVTEDVAGSGLLFSFVSSFESLTENQQNRVKDALRKKNVLSLIQTALNNFLYYYPNCPLKFLVTNSSNTDHDIAEIKSLLTALYDKRGTDTTFMLVNVVYHLFALDRLKVTRDTSLARLPEIRDYPESEISRRIASAVRAALYPMMQPPFYNPLSKWNHYFWNRGIELEPIKM